MNYTSIKMMIRTKIEPSIFYGILNEEVLSGKRPIGFCFYQDSENCYWPVNSNLYKLINDGWKIV